MDYEVKQKESWLFDVKKKKSVKTAYLTLHHHDNLIKQRLSQMLWVPCKLSTMQIDIPNRSERESPALVVKSG